MNILIVNPFAGADQQTAVWAAAEETVDFRADPAGAARCTLSFAATELKAFLARTLDGAGIAFAAAPRPCDFLIELQVLEPAGKASAFTLEPRAGGVRITGDGRTGTLFGAYEFLRLQGWRWFAPGPEGEIAPSPATRLAVPPQPVRGEPSFSLGRGFDFGCVSMESAELCLWMARNRLNVSGCRPATGPLCEKLGMSSALGGHIFEEILHPDRMLPSGRSLWEEHPDWFGLPANGRREKATAQQTQFCACRPELMDFLGDELLVYLNGKWRMAERIYIWGFDTWGSTCRCPDCQRLGNSSDQMLHIASHLRARIDRAAATGRLGHRPRLVLCAYEGTATLDGPQRPVPQNLVDAGDCITFYPINRCYAHDFAADGCSWNRPYRTSLVSWTGQQPGLPVTIGEYYNVSKFEDLPLLFTARIAADLPAYHRLGARGMTYMHLPMVNWAMRTLTQLLYAQVAWDVQTDVPAFLAEYFDRWYGPHAARLRQAYELLEEGWLACAQWRAWCAKSILSQLLQWDGRRPEQPLPGNDHLATGEVIAAGRHAASLMDQALALVEQAQADERARQAQASRGTAGGTAVNPAQQRALELQGARHEKRLGEDRRLLIYGRDVMAIMTEMVAYHDALYRRDAPAAAAGWKRLEQLADQLDRYCLPINFEEPGAGLVGRDALTRSQLRDCLRRCRQAGAGSGETGT